MEFWKMNGAGNDFLVIDNMSGEYDHVDWPKLASVLCERHMSIGADGFMVVEKPDGDADYKMLFFNNDGSVGEMCGNGARCICRYGYEKDLAGDIQRVETTAGVVIGERIDKRRYTVRLNDPSIIKMNQKTEALGKEYTYDFLELGNPGVPHMCVKIENLREYPLNELRKIGAQLRHCKVLPKGANVNFYELTGENKVFERTFERGVENFTYACGTGTASVVAALFMHGETGDTVEVEMAGGLLEVHVEPKEDDEKTAEKLWLTGPTNIVAKGLVTDEELVL